MANPASYSAGTRLLSRGLSRRGVRLTTYLQTVPRLRLNVVIVLLATVLLAIVLLATVLLATVLLATVLLATVLLATVLLATVLLATVLLAIVLLTLHAFFGFFTFMGPCIVNAFKQTNKMQRYTMVFITICALHVSGGSFAHHQELKTVYTASGICRAFPASYRYRE